MNVNQIHQICYLNIFKYVKYAKKMLFKLQSLKEPLKTSVALCGSTVKVNLIYKTVLENLY